MRFPKIARGAAGLAFFLGALSLPAQQPVILQVNVAESPTNHGKRAASADSANVAVWLTPLDAAAAATPTPSNQAEAMIIQKNKMFTPHVTVVRVGSSIAFPNEDPFFHNVFSLYNGKRFDLGLYEAGSTRTLAFDRLGVSYLFCNIHENMSAIVIAVDTNFYGVSDRAGLINLGDVPNGRYTLHIFYERSTADQLKGLERVVAISPSTRTLDKVDVPVSPKVTLAHKNKYGEDYVPPPASGYGP